MQIIVAKLAINQQAYRVLVCFSIKILFFQLPRTYMGRRLFHIGFHPSIRMIPTEYQPGHQGCGQTRQRDFPSLRSEMPRLCRSAWWPFKLCDNLFQYPFVTVSAGRYTCSVDDIGDFVHGMTFAVSAKILSTPIMHLIHLPGRMIRQCPCCCLSGSLCRDPALGVFLALGAQVIFLHFHLILFFVKVFIFAV